MSDVPEAVRPHTASRREESHTSSHNVGRGGFRSRGRGKGRGRSTGRGQGQAALDPRHPPVLATAADQQQLRGEAARDAAPVATAVQQSAPVPDRRPHNRRGRRNQQPQASAGAPAHPAAPGETGADAQRQPRPRARGQPRHTAAQHTTQQSGANALHQQAPSQRMPDTALADQALLVPGGPDCVVCCEPIQVKDRGTTAVACAAGVLQYTCTSES